MQDTGFSASGCWWQQRGWGGGVGRAGQGSGSGGGGGWTARCQRGGRTDAPGLAPAPSPTGSVPSAVAAGQRAHLKAAHSHHAARDGEGGALLAVALHLVSVGLVCPRLLAAHHLHRVGRQRRRQRVQRWRGRSGGGGVSPAQRGGQSAKGEGWVGVGQGGVGCRGAGEMAGPGGPGGPWSPVTSSAGPALE